MVEIIYQPLSWNRANCQKLDGNIAPPYSGIYGDGLLFYNTTCKLQNHDYAQGLSYKFETEGATCYIE